METGYLIDPPCTCLRTSSRGLCFFGVATDTLRMTFPQAQRRFVLLALLASATVVIAIAFIRSKATVAAAPPVSPRVVSAARRTAGNRFVEATLPGAVAPNPAAQKAGPPDFAAQEQSVVAAEKAARAAADLAASAGGHAE